MIAEFPTVMIMHTKGQNKMPARNVKHKNLSANCGPNWNL